VVISNLNGSQLLSGSHTIVSKPIITLNAIFIRYALMSKIIKSSIENEVTGIKVFSITQGILNNVTVTFPPLEEQQQIADYLDQQTAKIDQLINKAKSMVELLKEHKKSLINNVVTGKIKVING
jgi:type I restriction enzyme S subunit